MLVAICFFQAEDGIRDLVRSRGLGDVYKRQGWRRVREAVRGLGEREVRDHSLGVGAQAVDPVVACLLYTSDAADERSSVDLGGRRIIKKTKGVRTRDSTSSISAVTGCSSNTLGQLDH